MRLAVPSSSSVLPAQKPRTGPPMLLIAVVPARMMRSPHDKPLPYLSLIGHSRLLALSWVAGGEEEGKEGGGDGGGGL